MKHGRDLHVAVLIWRSPVVRGEAQDLVFGNRVRGDEAASLRQSLNWTPMAMLRVQVFPVLLRP